MTDDIRAIALQVPALAGYSGPIQRLGGLTNQVYRLGDHCLRLPGDGTQEYINRQHEAVAAAEAARVGVSPPLTHADPHSGIMVTGFIDNAATMTPAGFKTSPGSVARAALALRHLHQSDAVFPNRFELFTMIDDYTRILAGKDLALPEGYHAVVRDADAIRHSLAKNPTPLVASHCDPLCENFLDTGQRMWIVDWEYSGMNDAMWDLADLSVEGSFTESQDQELLHAYFNGAPAPADVARMVIYKAMCDLLWTLWGLIQLANANPADDFRGYATSRFARCKALMEITAG